MSGATRSRSPRRPLTIEALELCVQDYTDGVFQTVRQDITDLQVDVTAAFAAAAALERLVMKMQHQLHLLHQLQELQQHHQQQQHRQLQQQEELHQQLQQQHRQLQQQQLQQQRRLNDIDGEPAEDDWRLAQDRGDVE